MRRQATTANSISILNALTEEGWAGSLPLGVKISKPIRTNVLTSLTQDAIQDKRRSRKFMATGFLSRFVPLSYQYAEATKKVIRDYIKAREYQKEEIEKILIGTKKVELPKKFAEEIEGIALNVAAETKDANPTGFRIQRQLQTLAMSNTLLRKDNTVNEEDVEAIRKCSYYMNFNFNKV